MSDSLMAETAIMNSLKVTVSIDENDNVSTDDYYVNAEHHGLKHNWRLVLGHSRRWLWRRCEALRGVTESMSMS